MTDDELIEKLGKKYLKDDPDSPFFEVEEIDPKGFEKKLHKIMNALEQGLSEDQAFQKVTNSFSLKELQDNIPAMSKEELSDFLGKKKKLF